MRKTKPAPLLTAKRRTHALVLRSTQQRTSRLLHNYLLAKHSNRSLPG